MLGISPCPGVGSQLLRGSIAHYSFHGIEQVSVKSDQTLGKYVHLELGNGRNTTESSEKKKALKTGAVEIPS